MSKFDQAFEELIGHEGGFKKQSSDRMDWTGGQVGKGVLKGTKFGLSAGTYPDLDIENLTVEQAKVIYRRDWWDKFIGDDLDYEVAFQVFDADVNHGAGNGTRMVQRALGVVDDGHIGPITMAAWKRMERLEFCLRFLSERLVFMTKVSTWDENGRGWARRVASNMIKAVTP